jgi:hypothetical protein
MRFVEYPSRPFWLRFLYNSHFKPARSSAELTNKGQWLGETRALWHLGPQPRTVTWNTPTPLRPRWAHRNPFCAYFVGTYGRFDTDFDQLATRDAGSERGGPRQTTPNSVRRTYLLTLIKGMVGTVGVDKACAARVSASIPPPNMYRRCRQAYTETRQKAFLSCQSSCSGQSISCWISRSNAARHSPSGGNS